jgi:hypothetical protein
LGGVIAIFDTSKEAGDTIALDISFTTLSGLERARQFFGHPVDFVESYQEDGNVTE